MAVRNDSSPTATEGDDGLFRMALAENQSRFCNRLQLRRANEKFLLTKLGGSICDPCCPRSSETWSSQTAARFASPVARKRLSMPAHHCVLLQDAQPVPPAGPTMGQPNPH